jgi:hypothetical protein
MEEVIGRKARGKETTTKTINKLINNLFLSGLTVGKPYRSMIPELA